MTRAKKSRRKYLTFFAFVYFDVELRIFIELSFARQKYILSTIRHVARASLSLSHTRNFYIQLIFP